MNNGGLIGRFSRSIRVQLTALLIIFVLPPVLLYSVFRAAEAEKQTLLLNAVRENGSLVARALEPVLKDFQSGDFTRIQGELARFETDQRSIKILFRFNGGGTGFFYVASVPQVPTNALEQERKRLIDLGILDRLAGSCSGNVPLGDRVGLPGGTEVLTSVTPVQSGKGCWVVVVASNASSVVRLIDGRAYWKRPEARLAAAVYGAMALLVLLIFAAVWSALMRFRRNAAAIEAGRSFATSTAVPELAVVGQEFDAMVERLRRATQAMRQAAEDNAHAFKAPIAVMRQAVELVHTRVPDDGDAALGMAALGASLDRLEGLVRSAQRLDTAAADLLEIGGHNVDLSDLVEAFAASYRLLLGPRQAMLALEVQSDIVVDGGEEIFETMIENLVDNAVSFSPPGGCVRVCLVAEGGHATLTVEDEGPGVTPTDLPRIFERYYSSRPYNGSDAGAEMHFGIGLWLVRQNALALGGEVTAENRPSGGLKVAITLPRAR